MAVIRYKVIKVTKDLKVASLAEMKEKRDFNIKMNKEFPWWSV